MAVGFSFTDQRLVPNPNLSTQFVGVRNYVRLFQDQIFHSALIFNVIFVIVVVPVQTFCGHTGLRSARTIFRQTNVPRAAFIGESRGSRIVELTYTDPEMNMCKTSAKIVVR